jgi:zinc transport system permease protein
VINQFIEASGFAFVQRALLAGSLIAICCACLGVFLVLRRFALIGHGLAHVSLATIALGLITNLNPLLVSIPLISAASLWMLRLSKKAAIGGDSAVGMVSSLGIATGVLLASMGKGFNVDLFSYIFGNILTINRTETYFSVILSILVLGLVIFFYHDLFSITFDQAFAHVSGIKVNRINEILVVLTALTVLLGIKVVGIMLVSSLTVFPAIAALQIAQSFKKAIFWASVFAVAAVILGVYVSFLFNIPTGAAIIYFNFLFYLIARLMNQRKRPLNQ